MSEEKMPEIIKLSASAVKTYEQCPRKYYFNYIQKAPKKHWDHFDLGNICHKTLELFHTKYMKKAIPKKEWGKLMSESFTKAREGFLNLSDPLILDAKEMLAEYLKSVKENGMPVVKGCETSFDFKLAEDIMVRGFVDRIDILKDKKFRIIDYKTTKNDKYLEPFQLSVYGLWLKEQHPDIKSFKGAYVLLRHGSKLKEYDFNLEDIETARKDLIAYAKKIKEENTWTPIPTKLCNYCDFKDICQVQQSW